MNNIVMNNSHPSEIIQAEIIDPLGLTVEEVALRFGVPGDMLASVLAGRNPISQEISTRIGTGGL